MIRRILYVLAVLMLVGGLMPLGYSLATAGLAGIGGCGLQQAAEANCMIYGMSQLEFLVTLFIASWIIVVTFPIACAGLILLIGLVVYDFSRRTKSNQQT